VVNQIAISGPTQIYLRLRIAEISHSVKKQLGINWEAVGTVGSFVLGLGIGRDIVALGSTILRSGGADIGIAGGTSGNLSITGAIDALAGQDLITVLAETNLTAMSGDTAKFLAGGEFPIPYTSSDGGIAIEYKQFGVSLSFTPTLVGDGTINLAARPEVSQLSTVGCVNINGLQVPSLSTRRAETTVELASGQTFAIGGLLQNNVNQDLRKFPGLGDTPILGALFRSSEFQRNESELVIIVTPYLVRPVSPRKMALPTDGFVPANDYERIVKGQTQHSETKPETATPNVAVRPHAIAFNPAGNNSNNER
jgi:pilus assembly protein CpaC